MTNKLFIIISLFFFSTSAFGLVAIKSDSIPKNSVGISLRRFVNVVFKSPTSTPEILYIRRLSQQLSLRAGFTLETSSDNADLNLFGLGIGGTRTFSEDSKWRFYYGADLYYSYSYQKNLPTEYYEFAATPFLGIAFSITKRITLATEPGIYMQYLTQQDPTAFVKVPDLFKTGMANIGHIRLDFNF